MSLPVLTLISLVIFVLDVLAIDISKEEPALLRNYPCSLGGTEEEEAGGEVDSVDNFFPICFSFPIFHSLDAVVR